MAVRRYVSTRRPADQNEGPNGASTRSIAKSAVATKANAKKKASAASPGQLAPSHSPILAPFRGEIVAATPPWRKAAPWTALDASPEAFEVSQSDVSRLSNETSPSAEFVTNFFKAAPQDREFLTAHLESAASAQVLRVPGVWPETRQLNFGSWVTMLGFVAKWEGGYLFVSASSKERAAELAAWCAQASMTGPVVRSLALGSLKEEEEDVAEDGALPMPPLWGTRVSDRVSDALGRLSLQEEALPKRQSVRERKWQRSSILPTDGPLLSEVLGRRSSIALPRRSSIALNALQPRVSSLMPSSLRKSDLTTMKTVSDQGLLHRVLAYLDVATLLSTTSRVCKEWSHESLHAANSLFAANAIQSASYLSRNKKASTAPNALVLSSAAFYASFPEGSFLGDGAYKRVYKIRNAARNREEALSIMDISKIAKYGDPNVVAREVRVGLLLSDLVTKKICPNFVETYQVLQLDRGASEEETYGPSQSSAKDGMYQYVRLELCQHGDLEAYMKSLPDGAIPLPSCGAILFQLLVSLHAGRALANLRHYDVKCLNFFIADPIDEDSLVYELDDSTRFSLPAGSKVVKLADYGTAETEALSTQPITVSYFTTLENTPPEFLLLPSPCESFASDVFPLGLSALHLLTGTKPYEEILAHVKCPGALLEALAAVWCDEEEAEETRGFRALGQVLEDDEEDILFHTFYRYLVLMGLSGRGDGGVERASAIEGDSRVWSAVLGVLGAEAVIPKGSKAKSMKAARRQFEADSARYSLFSGTDRLIVRGRERGKALNAWELVKSMLALDPKERPDLERALRADSAFAEFQTSNLASSRVVYRVHKDLTQG